MTRPASLEGRYFPRSSSGSVDAYLSGTPDSLEITLADDEAAQPVLFQSVTDRLGNVARKISFQDGSVFECSDNDAVDAFFDHGSSFFGRLTRAESSWKFVGFAAIATVAVLIGIYRYGLPAMASAAASVTPASISKLIDAGALDTVDRVLFSESSLEEDRKAELTTLFGKLVKTSGESSPPLRLLFRNGGRIGANAIALPGGTIILTDQLVALAEKDDEIAGVLAHEIGHVSGRHSLKQIYRVLGIGFMVTIIGGDSGQIVEDVIAQAVAIESLSYSRKFESEADRHSVSVMLEADRDPYAFVDLLDRVVGAATKDAKETATDDTGWLSTHPGNADRRRDVAAHVEAIKGKE